MKKIVLVIAILAGVFTSGLVSAQVRVNINVGNQPLWGPTGYDRADYYYLPDVGVYFDISRNVFVYRDGNVWQTGPNLPGRYGNVDLYRVHKVVINRSNPWMYDNQYRGKYRSYRGRYDQTPIRDSRDNRYYANPQHPHHNEWNGNRGNNGNNGNGNGHYDNRGRGNNDRGDNDHRNNGNGHYDNGNRGNNRDDHQGGRR
ncbi:hypothetical protein ACTHGU_10240 [Chitinophagaceae bacterium MMS25-I14]